MSTSSDFPEVAPAPKGRRYERPRGRDSAARRRRSQVRLLVEALHENQWMVPVGAIVSGSGLAMVLSFVGQDPDPGSWTVDVNRARDSLMGLLSLVFAGLSIVLAVATVTTQNVVSRFSLRMLRIYQRDMRDEIVIGVFALSASFIMTEQVRLRGKPADELAPIPGVTVSLALIFISGIVMIWYLTVLSRWFRVDRTAQRVALEAARGARSLEDRYAGLDPVDLDDVEVSTEVEPLLVPRSGYFSGLDIDALYDLAVAHDVVIVVDRVDGSSVIRGEPMGRISPLGKRSTNPSDADLAETVVVTRSVTLEGALDYRIIVLVDIAIMALSPSVNDPNTAVQIVEEFTFLLPELAAYQLGPGCMADDDGNIRVAVNALQFGDYVDLATEQIVLYGAGDPLVVRSLERLIEVLDALDLEGPDAAAVDRLRERLAAAVPAGA